MAILKYKNKNGDWEYIETVAALKYTEQELTDAQKAQVKENLGIAADLNSKITIYNNVQPSTFDWWSAINQALGNTEVDDSNMQTGCFQLNLADGCYFTGFDNDWVWDKNKINSALVNFTVVYFSEGSHEMTLTIDWNGATYKSNVFGSSWYPDTGFSFAGIPDNIPFTKCVHEITAIPTTTINALFT